MDCGIGNRAPHIEAAHPLRLVTAPSFVIAVGLLILNDHLLKVAVGSSWTGKLSDFAGLFAFPVFCCALLSRARRVIFVATGVCFVIWKSPLSEGPLAAWNTLGVWPMSRVVDYSDWVALLVLVPAYRLVRDRRSFPSPATMNKGRRWAGVAIGVASILAFSATSMAPRLYSVAPPNAYDVSASRVVVHALLDSLGFVPSTEPHWPWRRERPRSADTLTIRVESPRHSVTLEIELRDGGPEHTAVTLLRAPTGGNTDAAEETRSRFAIYVIEPLRARARAWRARSPTP